MIFTLKGNEVWYFRIFGLRTFYLLQGNSCFTACYKVIVKKYVDISVRVKST